MFAALLNQLLVVAPAVPAVVAAPVADAAPAVVAAPPPAPARGRGRGGRGRGNGGGGRHGLQHTEASKLRM